MNSNFQTLQEGFILPLRRLPRHFRRVTHYTRGHSSWTCCTRVFLSSDFEMFGFWRKVTHDLSAIKMFSKSIEFCQKNIIVTYIIKMLDHTEQTQKLHFDILSWILLIVQVMEQCSHCVQKQSYDVTALFGVFLEKSKHQNFMRTSRSL